MIAGLGILTRKELLESWRTLRLPIVGGLFMVVGLSSPLLARFLPEIVEAAAGGQISIPMPTPLAADAANQLWRNLAQFGALAAIILAMGAVAGELDRGTAAFVLSKTASRGGFLAAKVAAIGAVLGLSTSLAVALGWIYTAVLFEPPAMAGWAVLAAMAWLGSCAWAAITFLGGVATGSSAAAAGIGFAAVLVLSLTSAIPTVSRFVPGGLAEPALALAEGASVAAEDLVIPIISTIALIAGALSLAAWSFRRREL